MLCCVRDLPLPSSHGHVPHWEDRVETSTGFEAQFFRTLNGFIEPAIRAGFGSPGIWPTGLIVLESTGRRTGRTYRVPVAATLWGHLILASTVRGERSQWLKNLSVTPALRYWLAGREHEADATVIAPGMPIPDGISMPALLRPLLPSLSFLSGLGMGFAVLTPRVSSGTTISERETRMSSDR